MKFFSSLVIGIVAGILIGIALFHKPVVGQILAQGNPGAIWTTNGSCGSPQNVNHYPAGAHIYINGSGFGNTTTYSWDVSDPGNNGTIYHSGNVTTDSSGAFCFDSGTYPSGGPYQAKVEAVKGDNFSIDAALTSTPTPTPTQGAGASPTPTPTLSPTPTPTPTVTPTPTPGTESTPMPTPTSTPGQVLGATTTTGGGGGGPGDGRSDGRSDGLSSCPSCTAPPSTTGAVLGVSTEGQVLGASTDTLAATGSNNTFLRLWIAAGSALVIFLLGRMFVRGNETF